MAEPRITNRRLKEIRSLSQKKHRERLGEMLVEGMRSVESALVAGAPIKEILVTATSHERAREFLDDASADVHVVSSVDLERISAVDTSQGILAVVVIEPLRAAALRSMERIIVFDGIQDPGNAGTLIRSAAWFGADAVVTAPGTVDLYNPKVVRAAMGGLWDVARASVEDLAEELTTLRKVGFTIYAADLEGTDVEQWKPQLPSVLILGSEAHGISDSVKGLIDQRVVIPGRSQRRGVESLNVAMAAGIILYEWTKGRKSW